MQAAGVMHPSELKAHHIMKRISAIQTAPLSTMIDILEPGDLLNKNYKFPVYKIWWEKSQTNTFGVSN